MITSEDPRIVYFLRGKLAKQLDMVVIDWLRSTRGCIVIQITTVVIPPKQYISHLLSHCVYIECVNVHPSAPIFNFNQPSYCIDIPGQLKETKAFGCGSNDNSGAGMNSAGPLNMRRQNFWQTRFENKR